MDAMKILTREAVLALRAGAHGAEPETLPEPARLRHGTLDLEAARLIHLIEQGNVIVPRSYPRSWRFLDTLMPHMTGLSRIVEECLRVGLVYADVVRTGPSIRRTQLAASVVHLDRGGRTACNMSDAMPMLRYRLLDDLSLVDCLACENVYRRGILGS